MSDLDANAKTTVPPLAPLIERPFSIAEYAARRQALMAELGPDAVALIPAAKERQRNHDIEYPFRQNSDLLYLTGFPEPEALVVLAPGHTDGALTMFCRAREPDKERWQGYRAGPEGAKVHYQADQAFPLTDLDEQLPKLLSGRQTLYYDIGFDPAWDRCIIDCLNTLRRKARAGVVAPHRIVFLGHLLHEQRLLKRPAELVYLRQAADIGIAAHRAALRACRPGAFEYTLEAALLHEFYRQGTVASYPPIVAAGAHAGILHYTANRGPLQADDLVLIDAGAELHGYASDITRTFPIAGRFTAAQLDLYQLVLAAQTAALDYCRPGQPWDAPHQAVLKVLTQGLVDFGLLTGAVDTLIEEEAYKPFFMHKTGHWLGLDTHDVGYYRLAGQWRALQPGMYLTVEPGLYIAEDCQQARPQWRGLGIRIEDDVLITETGHEVFSVALPKDPEELAALVGGQDS